MSDERNLIEYIFAKAIKKMHLRAIKNSTVDKNAKIFVNSTIGKYSYIGYDCTIINTNIGNFCSFGADLKIGGASHPIEWGSSSPIFCGYRNVIKKKFAMHNHNPSKITTIGHDVWIGDGAYIKAGVQIGNGAVVGMNSVVTKNIDNYEIWAGNPAQCIRKRFNEDIIRVLESSNWWEWDDQEIEKIAPFINNIDAFVKELEKRTNK